jgi:hypothetical protein
MDSIDYADVPSPYVLQHPRNAAALVRRHEKMDVIAHQDVRVNSAIPANGRLMQALEIKAAIHLAKKARGAIIPPLDHVKRKARNL